MAKKVKKNELGLGIRALLSDIEDHQPKPKKEKAIKELTNRVAMLPLEAIHVNPFQPRKEFDAEQLEDLSKSIKVHGLIQPISVRSMGNNEFQLISGERRLRASKIAQLESIPAYIRSAANDQEMLEMALIENIQRQDLNPVEVAITYQRLLDECQLTHENLSDRVGKRRSTVTNFIGLLKLPPQIQQGLKEETISMGHAKALRSIKDIALQLSVYNETIDKGLSVRALEDLVRRLNQPAEKKSTPQSSPIAGAYQDIQNRLCTRLESKVEMKIKGKGKGQIVINFKSDDELNRILDFIDP